MSTESIETRKAFLKETPPNTRNPQIRLDFVKRDQGFLPSSQDELSDAYGLLLKASRGIGTDGHLGHIRARRERLLSRDKDMNNEEVQDAVKAESHLAVIRNVRDYETYFRNARSAYSRQAKLYDQIASYVPVDPGTGLPQETTLTLADVFTVDDPAIRTLLRFNDLRTMAATVHTGEPLRFNPLKVNYGDTRRNTFIGNHIDEFMRNTNLYGEQGGALLMAEDSMADQSSRQFFWDERLVEAKIYGRDNELGSLVLAQTFED
jgi:hypothetical protein